MYRSVIKVYYVENRDEVPNSKEEKMEKRHEIPVESEYKGDAKELASLRAVGIRQGGFSREIASGAEFHYPAHAINKIIVGHENEV